MGGQDEILISVRLPYSNELVSLIQSQRPDPVVADVLQFLQKVRRVAPYLRNQNFHHSSHIIRTFAVSQRGHLNDIIHSRHAVFKIQVAKSNR